MAAFIEIASDFRDSVLRRAADARQNSSKYAIEAFNVTSGKQILAKKPGDFQAFAVLGDFASKMETRRARRTHAQSRGKIRQRNLRHGMILQSKAHLEKWIVSRPPIARRARAPTRRKGWRWQTSQPSTDARPANDQTATRERSTCPRKGTMPA